MWHGPSKLSQGGFFWFWCYTILPTTLPSRGPCWVDGWSQATLPCFLSLIFLEAKSRPKNKEVVSSACWRNNRGSPKRQKHCKSQFGPKNLAKATTWKWWFSSKHRFRLCGTKDSDSGEDWPFRRVVNKESPFHKTWQQNFHHRAVTDLNFSKPHSFLGRQSWIHNRTWKKTWIHILLVLCFFWKNTSLCLKDSAEEPQKEKVGLGIPKTTWMNRCKFSGHFCNPCENSRFEHEWSQIWSSMFLPTKKPEVSDISMAFLGGRIIVPQTFPNHHCTNWWPNWPPAGCFITNSPTWRGTFCDNQKKGANIEVNWV